MPRLPRILLAITSHGLGHLTRSLAIAGALRELHQRIELIVGTTLPRSRVARDLPPPFEYRAVDYEPGVLQVNCFQLDREATRLAYRRFLAERAERLEAEQRFLRESRCDAVITDIPALPVRAAAALGIPAIGISNFTWDWILEPLLENSTLQDVPRILADDYAQGTLHLRLPFGPASSPFPCSEEAPLVNRPARRAPRDVRKRLGLPAQDERPLVLVCPGGWDPMGWSEIHVRGCEGLRFLTVGDLPVSADVPVLGLAHDLPLGIAFPDLVAAADVVLTKPGYGIALRVRRPTARRSSRSRDRGSGKRRCSSTPSGA